MRILSLDISSKTGWAYGQVVNGKFQLLDLNTLTKQSEPKGEYPGSYLVWSKNIFNDIFKVMIEHPFDVLIIESTSKGSKNARSQCILEWTHYLVSTYIVENKIKPKFYMTGEWRKLTGCVLTKEEKEKNKEVRKQHKTGARVAKGADGKRIGLSGKKHVNIRRANEIFGLSLIRKDEDRADACLMIAAYCAENKIQIEKTVV